jgi:hypothetical protein
VAVDRIAEISTDDHEVVAAQTPDVRVVQG